MCTPTMGQVQGVLDSIKLNWFVISQPQNNKVK